MERRGNRKYRNVHNNPPDPPPPTEVIRDHPEVSAYFGATANQVEVNSERIQRILKANAFI